MLAPLRRCSSPGPAWSMGVCSRDLHPLAVAVAVEHRAGLRRLNGHHGDITESSLAALARLEATGNRIALCRPSQPALRPARGDAATLDSIRSRSGGPV